MTGHAVVIAGAGPTGLMLAAELAVAGIDVAIVERRSNQDLEASRAGGLHSRTIEVLDQRGVAERFLSRGQTAQVVAFNMVRLDISDFPTRHPYGLALFQNHFERILAGWVEELGVPIHREREVTGFAQDDTGVDVELSGGGSIRAGYLVGCDGGRSAVRKTAGIDFAGSDATMSWLLAEVETTEEPAWGVREDDAGVHAIGRAGTGAYARIVLTERRLHAEGEPSLAEFRDALTSVYGTDFGIHNPRWLSRFNDATRQASAYRDRRVLLAGDAAHIHPPMGGQGLNVGVQDAVNVGWKLARVVKGTSPENLLDSYHAERHPVAERVLLNTMAQAALRRRDERTRAMADYVAEFLRADETRKRLAAEMSGLGIRYDFGDGHPLLGRRMPDLDVVTTDGPRRVFTLLHQAWAVLLNLGARGAVNVGQWADRVQLVDAEYDGAWELPVLGAVAAPAAVLVRPDGYVAWVGDGGGDGLSDALAKWFGPPNQRSMD